MPDFDVIVCGAGASGVTAALAAARSGAHTLLIERYGFAGGSSTASLVYPWMSFHSNHGEQVIGGLAQEIVDRLVERGGSPGHLRDTIGFTYSVTPFDTELYKLLLDELFEEAGVEVRYHTTLAQVETDADQVKTIHTTGKGGSRSYSARFYIDASGDGDLAVAAGADYHAGRPDDGRMQPMTMNFVLHGVEIDAIREYMQAHPEDFHPGSRISALDQSPLTGGSGFFEIWKQHAPAGIPRDRMLFFIGLQPGEVMVNTTRILHHDGTIAEELSQAEIEGRRQIRWLVEFCREYLPGFRHSTLARMPTQVGVRETRHIVGQYTLTAQDILSARRFPDVIARNGYPLDVHDPNGDALESQDIVHGAAYDIPYRCLVPQRGNNLLVTGRCISSTHTASSSARLTPCCMALGEAAGVAAALAVQKRRSAAEVPVEELQSLLRRQGAILE